jgi:hypothetical protein
MALSITAIDTAAQDLLTCVCNSLAALPVEVPGLAGCPCRTCVVPGAVAADGCDETCGAVAPDEYPGQLTVSVVRIYSTDRQSFPRELATVRDNRGCQPQPVTAVELAVTLFRCTPLPSDDGCPPSCESLSASALQLHVDMLAVQRAALCCYAGTDTVTRGGRRYTLGGSRTLGPQGGCVGLEQRLTVGLDGCLVCPPEGL